MRRSWLAVVSVAACSSGEGARLTLRAPGGPSDAGSLELVLASPALVPVVPGQRVSPMAITTETVTYFLQRTTAGAIAGGHGVSPVDGYAIVLEPSPAIADTTFIPFVLLYDASGSLAGLGSYHADPQSPAPSPILVQRGEIDQYTLDVEPVEICAGQARVIDIVDVDTHAGFEGRVEVCLAEAANACGHRFAEGGRLGAQQYARCASQDVR